MKTVVVLCVAVAILGIGIFDVFKQKSKTNTLDEILSFINFVKGEFHYRTSDFNTLIDYAKKQNYKSIKFEQEKILLDDYCDEVVKTEFYQFVNRIGTTDTEGQIALCDEYATRFLQKLNDRKQNEKSKIQINTALSVLSAVCVIILFI